MTLRLVTRAGFMVNLWKCRFCVSRGVILGLEISRMEVRLGKKSLKRWMGV